SGAPLWDSDLQVVTGMITSVIGVDEIEVRDAHGAVRGLRMPFDRGWRQTTTAFAALVETLRAACPLLRLADDCPYRGLEVFEADHADYYFGRESSTKE